MNFQEKLLKLRKEHGWGQSDLAEKVGIHIGHLSRLENGHSQPSVEVLQKLAKVFGVTMDYLMTEDAEILQPISVHDKTLAERLQLIDTLDDVDRQTIINVIDSMLTKKRILELLTRQVSIIDSGDSRSPMLSR